MHPPKYGPLSQPENGPQCTETYHSRKTHPRHTPGTPFSHNFAETTRGTRNHIEEHLPRIFLPPTLSFLRSPLLREESPLRTTRFTEIFAQFSAHILQNSCANPSDFPTPRRVPIFGAQGPSGQNRKALASRKAAIDIEPGLIYPLFTSRGEWLQEFFLGN